MLFSAAGVSCCEFPLSDRPVHRSSRKLLGRLLRENVRHYWGWIALALIAMAITSAATGFSAKFMENIVNDIFVQAREDLLWPTAAVVFVVFAVKGLSAYAQATLMAYVGQRIVADNQVRLFDHIARMDVAYFHNTNTGDLIARFLYDVNAMRGAVSDVLTSLGKDLLTLIALIAVMFYQDWVLAAVSFLVFPAALLPIVKLGRRMRKVAANTQVETGLFTTLLEQTINGMRVVKAYGMEAYETGRVRSLVERVFQLSMKAIRTRAMASPIMESLGGFAIGVVILYGGARVIDGATTAGAFFSFITALLLAYEPMKRLANLNVSLQTGLAGADRLFHLLDTPAGIQQKPDAIALPPIEGHVQFRGVTFSYGPEVPALAGVNIDIPAGKTVALVGPSGAGKTTILNMVPRFYDAEAGAVLIDGHDVRDVTFDSLRSNIALVSQDVTLFDDTVRANIAYGRLGASQEEIEDAARHAAAHDFILELSNGYDTMVGEQGVRLSGGQRQRLAIARAMLKNAPVLLLDEATSALDAESERHIQTALEDLMKDRTTLVIAHRLSTVMNADRIYVVRAGKIAEMGAHAELIAKDGLYRRLHDLQFGEDAAEATA